ncbi:MAG TPA: HPr-rel-A system PqqD family peptide chaperone [Alphaproteobacteria bacterium]|nr:HPr-rel-A system PqqD family peptide chaperone [Alphaproteobacteria bacterium]
MSDGARRWAVPAAIPLQWRRWADDFLVFNTASGETHYLDLIAAAVLRHLESRPASCDEIVSELRRAFPDNLEPPGLGEIAALLQRFDALGLVAPAAP